MESAEVIARHPYRMQGLAIINVQKSCYFFLEITVFFLFSFGGKIGIICIVCFWFVKVFYIFK